MYITVYCYGYIQIRNRCQTVGIGITTVGTALGRPGRLEGTLSTFQPEVPNQCWG